MFQRYYKILGVTNKSGAEEVKRAYRRLAKKYHPDVNPDPSAVQKFIDATQAYDRVIDKINRPSLYKYTYTKKAYHKAKKRKAARKEHPADRGRRYSKMKYKKYKQKSSAFTDAHNFWLYRCLFYGMQLFVYSIMFMLALLCVAATLESWNPVLMVVFSVTIYVFYKALGFFKNWKKDFKNVFKDQ